MKKLGLSIHRIAWTLIVGGVITSGARALQAQAAGETMHLGPEAWLAICGALVTLGINLEQLRRVRGDVRTLSLDLRTQSGEWARNLHAQSLEGARKHEDNQTAMRSLDHRLVGVEAQVKLIARQREG